MPDVASQVVMMFTTEPQRARRKRLLALLSDHAEDSTLFTLLSLHSIVLTRLWCRLQGAKRIAGQGGRISLRSIQVYASPLTGH